MPSIPETPMAQLLVRNLDDDVVRALKERAAKNGRSAEAEHRAILRQVLFGDTAPKKSWKDLLLEAPDVGDDADFERIRGFPRDIDLA